MPTCSTCGFLAMRDGRETVEVLRNSRTKGVRIPPNRPIPVPASFYCYAGSNCLESPTGDGVTAKDALRSIEREHDCADWILWRAGKTPKEHEEMSLLEQVRAEQAAWREEERQERLQRFLSERTTRIIALASAAGTILGAIVALMALYVSLSK